METVTLTVIRGLPASGKTTVAMFLVDEGWVRVSRDALRAEMFGAEHKGAFGHTAENVITEVEETQARAALKAGFPVVVDDMNLRNSYVKRWNKLAFDAGANFRIVDLTDVPLEECLRRNATREDAVEDFVIENLHRKFIKGKPHPLPYDGRSIYPVVPEPYIRPDYKPPAIIVDLDGTVALHNGRSPYDYSLVSEDTPNRPVMTVIDAWAREYPEGEVLFTSGRPDSCRTDTEDWLEEHFGLRFIWTRTTLLMRGAEDKRPDQEVKLELFNRYIRKDYRVEFVLDDRDRVVNMWRSLGLTCLQVAPGDF